MYRSCIFFLRFDPCLCAQSSLWSRELNEFCRQKITNAKIFILDCVRIRAGLTVAKVVLKKNVERWRYLDQNLSQFALVSNLS